MAKRCVDGVRGVGLRDQGAGGVICVKTKQSVLIAVYDDKTQPGEGACVDFYREFVVVFKRTFPTKLMPRLATKIVEALADYLISVNY
jgi:hypothetical protein